MQPRSEVSGGKSNQRLDILHHRSLGEVIGGLVDFHLFEGGLLGGECLSSGLVCAIRGQPHAMAKSEYIVIRCDQVGGPLARAEVAVLFVIPESDHDAQQACLHALLGAYRTEGGARFELVDGAHAVFDVVGRGQAIHLELVLRALHLLAKCAQQDVVSRRNSRTRGGRETE